MHSVASISAPLTHLIDRANAPACTGRGAYTFAPALVASALLFSLTILIVQPLSTRWRPLRSALRGFVSAQALAAELLIRRSEITSVVTRYPAFDLWSARDGVRNVHTVVITICSCLVSRVEYGGGLLRGAQALLKDEILQPSLVHTVL
jgi:hypothetical protein